MQNSDYNWLKNILFSGGIMLPAKNLIYELHFNENLILYLVPPPTVALNLNFGLISEHRKILKKI